MLVAAGAAGLLFESDSVLARQNRSRQIAETLVAGKVVRVSDGDTLVVLEELGVSPKGQGGGVVRQVKIRLDGIDAPEKSQPFGTFCRKKLSDKVAGKRVQVHVRKLDRYGRSLGRIEAPGMANVNLDQVKEGCAWFYRQYAREHSEAERRAFETAESLAKRQGLGLWKDKNPTPPWDFRREKKRGKREGDDPS